MTLLDLTQMHRLAENGILTFSLGKILTQIWVPKASFCSLSTLLFQCRCKSTCWLFSITNIKSHHSCLSPPSRVQSFSSLCKLNNRTLPFNFPPFLLCYFILFLYSHYIAQYFPLLLLQGCAMNQHEAHRGVCQISKTHLLGTLFFAVYMDSKYACSFSMEIIFRLYHQYSFHITPINKLWIIGNETWMHEGPWSPR